MICMIFKIFSPIMWFVFSLSFEEQKFYELILVWLNPLMSVFFDLRTVCQIQNKKRDLCHMFSSRMFAVLGFMFRSICQFELTFILCIKVLLFLFSFYV